MKLFFIIKLLPKITALLILPVLCYFSFSQVQELPHVTSKKWTTKYDTYFRKYTKRYFGVGFDWKWFKAQAIAESNLKDDAQSWVGAKGIMQIVPSTFEEIKKKNPSFTDVGEPRWNIAAGIYYNFQQYKRWKGINSPHRLCFMFGSYNAGRSTILRAQRVSKQAGYPGIQWDHIEAVAEKVPRWRHTETLGYVRKIFTLMGTEVK